MSDQSEQSIEQFKIPKQESVEKSEMKLRMYLFVCVWEKFTRIHGNLLIIKDDFQR